MNDQASPIFHVIAGPNGAGKTSLYYDRIQPRFPQAEFVNADELAKKEFGHAAETIEESVRGQELAEQRRRQLMAERKDLVTESTFSHPSKVDLVREAKESGYQVMLYHVNVRSPQISVMRVQNRVEHGGHPVPEDKIRTRYERNQAFIREAARIADRAYIFDNSALGQSHKLAVVLERGQAVRVAKDVPAWARNLYAKELEAFAPERQNRAAASFESARQIAALKIGQGAQTYIPRAGRYTGKVIGETDLHVVQQVGRQSAVAHFRSAVGRDFPIGTAVEIAYDAQGKAIARTAHEVKQDKSKADVLRTKPPLEAVKRFPELAGAFALVRAAEARVGPHRPEDAAKVASRLREDLARRIERGEPLPKVARADRRRDIER